MKILKRSITVLVCLILFTSCTKSIDGKKEKEYIEERKGIIYYKDEPFTGEMFENYKNGQLQLKENYKDDFLFYLKAQNMKILSWLDDDYVMQKEKDLS